MIPPKYGGGCKLMHKGKALVVRSKFQVQGSTLKFDFILISTWNPEP
jgi:hypothetical protein